MWRLLTNGGAPAETVCRAKVSTTAGGRISARAKWYSSKCAGRGPPQLAQMRVNCGPGTALVFRGADLTAGTQELVPTETLTRRTNITPPLAAGVWQS